jgi:hypothetical protein
LVLAALTGAAAAVLGAFLHAATVVVGDAVLPVGLVPAVALVIAAGVLALRHSGPAGAWASATGWLAMVMALTWPRAAGDIVIPGTWYGYAFMGLGLLAALGLVGRAWWRELPTRTTTAEPSSVR